MDMYGTGSQQAQQAQVFATLIALLFSVPGLDWTSPADHLEVFSGDMEVTKAEWRVP